VVGLPRRAEGEFGRERRRKQLDYDHRGERIDELKGEERYKGNGEMEQAPFCHYEKKRTI